MSAWASRGLRHIHCLGGLTSFIKSSTATNTFNYSSQGAISVGLIADAWTEIAAPEGEGEDGKKGNSG